MIYNYFQPAPVPRARGDDVFTAVFDADTNVLLGTLSDVSPTGANDVWHIKNCDKEYLVPAIPDVIVSVDINTNTIKIRPLPCTLAR